MATFEKITVAILAKKYGKTFDEVKKALEKLGYVKRITSASIILPDFLAKLKEHFKNQNVADKSKGRKIGGAQIRGKTQVEIKKVRSFIKPSKTPVVVAPEMSETPEVIATPVAPNGEFITPSVKTDSAPVKSSSVESAITTTVTPTISQTEDLVDKQIQQQKESAAQAITVSTTKTPPPKNKPIIKAPKKVIKVDPKIVAQRERERQKRLTRGEQNVTPAPKHVFQQPTKPIVREIPLSEVISVNRLAREMSVKTADVIRQLMNYGIEDATSNKLLERETAWIIVEEFGHKPVEGVDESDIEIQMLETQKSDAPLQPRPPVVTIMGHVDHGKTSLLDYIRKTKVASGEAGGITQHIGAYMVSSTRGDITFLDTPGHELFSQMRSRGAQITDIIVLVVAGNDGVKPQTIEAIAHAKAAKVPIVVAANKKDVEGFDMERLKNELSSHDVLVEDWGGDTMMIPISAKTGEGVDNLLESIGLQRDILELKAAIETPAQATVIEACVDKGRGALTTVVVRQGILRRNDYVVCGGESGRVRAMWSCKKQMITEALVSMPVEIQGLSGLPEVGEELMVVADERKAREIASLRKERNREKIMNRRVSRPLVFSLNNAEHIERKELNVIVKADVGGSREALSAALTAISSKKAAIKVIHSAIGGVSESDINLARASNALIIAFNVRPDGKSRKLAQSYGVNILYSNVIYEIIEKSKAALLDLLDAEREEKVIGIADVLQIFSISKIGNIAGCRVSDGIIRSDAKARLVRDGTVVYENDIGSLRHFKEIVEEVRIGDECGISIRHFNDIKSGDVIESVRVIELPPSM